jgi:hypothetical protein
VYSNKAEEQQKYRRVITGEIPENGRKMYRLKLISPCLIKKFCKIFVKQENSFEHSLNRLVQAEQKPIPQSLSSCLYIDGIINIAL